MIKKSYSKVDLFKHCKYRYKLKYLDNVKVLPNYEPTNALYLGSMLHKALETNVDIAVKEYLDIFPIMTDQHVEEIIKIESLVPRVKKMLPTGFYEVEIGCEEFVGYIDLLTEDSIYDFKYSNNTERYMNSAQLHVYKYYVEKITGKKINHLYYVFVPKVQIRQKKTETVEQFRKRLREELANREPKIEEVPFDQSKVDEFLSVDLNTSFFPKTQNKLCNWCEYQGFCERGEMYDII